MKLTTTIAGVAVKVNVPDELGEQLIASGTYKKAGRARPSSTGDDAKAKAEAEAAAKAEAEAKAAAEAEAAKKPAGGAK